MRGKYKIRNITAGRRSKLRSGTARPRSRVSTLSRMLRPAPPGRLVIKRTAYGGNWTMGTATTSDFWRFETFNTSKINNFAEIAALFDEYKINAIKVTYRPKYDSVIATTGAGTTLVPQAYAHVLVDPGSTLAPTGLYTTANLNTFLENQGVRTKTLNKPFSIYFRPKMSDQVLGGGTASRVIPSKFVKTSETAVDFRGYHIFLQQNNMGNTNTQVSLDVFYTFYMTLKNPK